MTTPELPACLYLTRFSIPPIPTHSLACVDLMTYYFNHTVINTLISTDPLICSVSLASSPFPHSLMIHYDPLYFLSCKVLPMTVVLLCSLFMTGLYSQLQVRPQEYSPCFFLSTICWFPNPSNIIKACVFPCFLLYDLLKLKIKTDATEFFISLSYSSKFISIHWEISPFAIIFQLFLDFCSNSLFLFSPLPSMVTLSFSLCSN